MAVGIGTLSAYRRWKEKESELEPVTSRSQIQVCADANANVLRQRSQSSVTRAAHGHLTQRDGGRVGKDWLVGRQRTRSACTANRLSHAPESGILHIERHGFMTE
jgi:hypothetical protein